VKIGAVREDGADVLLCSLLDGSIRPVIDQRSTSKRRAYSKQQLVIAR